MKTELDKRHGIPSRRGATKFLAGRGSTNGTTPCRGSASVRPMTRRESRRPNVITLEAPGFIGSTPGTTASLCTTGLDWPCGDKSAHKFSIHLWSNPIYVDALSQEEFAGVFCPVDAGRPTTSRSPRHPAAASLLRYSFSGSAPATQPTQRSALRRILREYFPTSDNVGDGVANHRA